VLIAKRSDTISLCLILALSCFCSSPKIHSQTTSVKASAAQPSKQQTGDFIRGKLLSLAPHDGKHEYSDVNAQECSVKVRFKGDAEELLDIDFQSLDPSALAWEVQGNNDQNKVILLTLVSTDHYGLRRSWYDDNASRRSEHLATYAMAFSFAKAAEIPDFQKRMTEAVKHLIVLCKV
jgi:hypothetical protein